MSHLDILLPFALPPPELAGDLMRVLQAPALATLLSRTRAADWQAFDEYSGMLAHEAWLARQFGLHDRIGLGGSPPLATTAMRAFGLTADAGTWFLLHPVHIHIARDHLVLTDLRQQALSESESRALFESALPLFQETGKTLHYGDAANWFVRADEWDALQTSTPDAASGHNIDIWMPKGRGERDWRKLQNEVQMHWHTHPVNAQREERGAKPVNSLWLWGGAPAAMQAGPAPYTDVFNLSGWARAFVQAPLSVRSAAEIVGAAPSRGLLLLDALIEPAMGADWALWLEKMRELERDWFVPLREALGTGKLGQLRLILTQQAALAQFDASRNSLRKFWIKPALARLFP